MTCADRAAQPGNLGDATDPNSPAVKGGFPPVQLSLSERATPKGLRIDLPLTSSAMTPAEFFTAVGRALYEDEFVGPMASRLDVERNTVGKWAFGKSRVPPRVWLEIAGTRREVARRSRSPCCGWPIGIRYLAVGGPAFEKPPHQL
jgi:hypothetical protein